MLTILGIIQFLLILFICKKEYEYNSSAIFLWATLLMMFGIPHLATTFFNDTVYQSWVINEASIFVILFCIIYILSRALLTPLFVSTRPTMAAFSFTANSLVVMRFLFCGLFFVVSFKLYEISQHAGGLLSSSWASGREIALNQDYLSGSKLILSLYYPFSSAFLYALIIKNKKYTFFSAFLILICVIFSRNRIEVIPLLICVIIYLLYIKRNMSLKKVITFSFIAYLSLYLINALLIFRYYGSVDTFLNDFNFSDFNSRVSENISGDKGELSLREVFYYFINNDNQFANFNEGHTYLRMLMVILPTGLAFGLKPPDFAISMGAAYRSDLTGFSTHPTLFGDCYANFGFYGILLAGFWAFFVIISDKMILNNKSVLLKLILLVSISCSYIIIARGSVYNSFSILVFSIIIIYFIYYLLKKILKKTFKSL